MKKVERALEWETGDRATNYLTELNTCVALNLHFLFW